MKRNSFMLRELLQFTVQIVELCY